MLMEKCKESEYEGFITLDNKNMDDEQYRNILDQEVSKLYAKYFPMCLDARGILAYGLIHSKGSLDDK